MVLLLVVVIMVAAIGYVLYQHSLQPDIQATNIQFGHATVNPQMSVVEDLGRISNGGSFSYIAASNNIAYLVFDNAFSFITTKQVSATYSVGGSSSTQSFTINAGATQTIQVPLNQGQYMAGSFTVSGGSGNDLDFSIEAYTCSQTIPFSLTLVNSGSANGYAVLSLHIQSSSSGGNSVGPEFTATTVAGQPVATGVLVTNGTVFSDKYYVQQGQQMPISGTASILDCGSHTIVPVVSQVQKG
jgi:hypothetical protein